MNYDGFSKEQLVNLIKHLEKNFIPDNVIFRSYALVSNEQLTESIKLLQKQAQDLDLENRKLKAQVDNLKFHIDAKDKELLKNKQNKKNKIKK